MSWKVALVSNHDIETYVESWATEEEFQTKEKAQNWADKWNNKYCYDTSPSYAEVKENFYVLWRGIAEFV